MKHFFHLRTQEMQVVLPTRAPKPKFLTFYFTTATLHSSVKPLTSTIALTTCLRSLQQPAPTCIDFRLVKNSRNVMLRKSRSPVEVVAQTHSRLASPANKHHCPRDSGSILSIITPLRPCLNFNQSSLQEYRRSWPNFTQPMTSLGLSWFQYTSSASQLGHW